MKYFWRYAVPTQHIEATVDAAEQAVLDDGFQFNPIQNADFRAQIAERLELAEAGQLKPVEHVKTIRNSPQIDMYEIRWNHLNVLYEDRVSGLKQCEVVLLRLYYVEQGGQWVVGVHVHRKQIVEDDDEQTRSFQDSEISTAVDLTEQLKGKNWGLDPSEFADKS